jgi:hypothetical protein
MPILKNPKHEAYCQLTVQGARYAWTQADIYVKSGFRAVGHSAAMAGSRLMKRDDIQRRIGELTRPSINRTRASVLNLETLLVELEITIADAREAKQHSVVVQSLALAAKLVGLMRDRVEIGSPAEFHASEDVNEIAARLLGSDGDVDRATALADELAMEIRRALIGAAAARARPVGSSLNGQ